MVIPIERILSIRGLKRNPNPISIIKKDGRCIQIQANSIQVELKNNLQITSPGKKKGENNPQISLEKNGFKKYGSGTPSIEDHSNLLIQKLLEVNKSHPQFSTHPSKNFLNNYSM